MEANKATAIALAAGALLGGGVGLALGRSLAGPEPPALAAASPSEPTDAEVQERSREREALDADLIQTRNANDRLRSEIARLELDQGASAARLRVAEEKWAEAMARITELRESHLVLARDLEIARAAAGPSEPAPPAEPRPFVVGKEIPDGAAKALGLDAAQVQSVNAVLAAEGKRLADSVREMIHREFPDKVGDDMENKSAGQLVVASLLDKLMPEIKQATAEANLWDVLGKDSASWKLAEVMQKARASTFEELGRVVTPEQLASIRKDYLQPGNFLFPGNLNLGFPELPAKKAPEDG